MDWARASAFKGGGGFLPNTPAARCRTISPLAFSMKTATSVSRSTANSMVVFSPALVAVGFLVNVAAGCSAQAAAARLLPQSIPTNKRNLFMFRHLPWGEFASLLLPGFLVPVAGGDPDPAVGV